MVSSTKKIFQIFQFTLALLLAIGWISCKKTAALYHSNGAKYESFEFFLQKNQHTGVLDTVRTGVSTVWDSLGNKVAESHFSNGVFDGISKEYYRSGKIRVLSHYKNGALESSFTYYDNGIILDRFKKGSEDTIFRYGLDGTIDTTIGLQWSN